MKNILNMKFVSVAFTIIVSILILTCRPDACSEEDIQKGRCANSYVDKKSNPVGSLQPYSPIEKEPNDYFYQAMVLPQTITSDGTVDPSNEDYTITATIDSDVDEDWYAITLSSEDFDRIDGGTTSNPNCKRVVTSSTSTLNDMDEGTYYQCYNHDANGNAKTRPNGTNDHKEYVTCDVQYKPNANLCGQSGFTGITVYGKYFKPRFIVRVEAEDANSPLGLRVEVYPPNLNIDYNGALTKNPIADSFDHASRNLSVNADDNTLISSGPLRLVGVANGVGSREMRLNFPTVWTYNVRVNDLDINNPYYHTCFTNNAINNPAAAYALLPMSYQELVKKDLSSFRLLDEYSVGTYYIRVTSNSLYRGKKYKIKWYWNTGKVSEGGVSQWTLKKGAVQVEKFTRTYDDNIVQVTGATGSSGKPNTCNCSSPGAGKYSGEAGSCNDDKRPTCQVRPPPPPQPPQPYYVTCNNGNLANIDVSTGDGILCYNAHNIAQSVSTTGNSYEVCEGDWNGDGIFSSSPDDLGCLIADAETACLSNGGYTTIREVKMCDCLFACYNNTPTSNLTSCTLTKNSDTINCTSTTSLQVNDIIVYNNPPAKRFCATVTEITSSTDFKVSAKPPFTATPINLDIYRF
ncbi:MAG: hypothetical protein D6767_07670 [Candidatus Hydrogenedentota bacterium]|nr:MAG: hypothetical protein D6767_07670 [Candidatus Hydrogenedentota bacterium]